MVGEYDYRNEKSQMYGYDHAWNVRLACVLFTFDIR
jgi:hypothetical protein